MMDYLIAGIALAGALFSLIGSIGVLRMPDLFMRTSAATKASTFGLGLTLSWRRPRAGEPGYDDEMYRSHRICIPDRPHRRPYDHPGGLPG